MIPLEELVSLSTYVGMRFDLVQGAGGNISVKEGDQLWIKRSGFVLSDVKKEEGHCIVSLAACRKILQEMKQIQGLSKQEKEARLVSEMNRRFQSNPSIETLVHAVIPKRYVVHTHPLCVLAGSFEELQRRLPQCRFVGYKTPGLDLASAVENETVPVIFLQNHGLIIAHDDLQEILPLQEDVLKQIEEISGIDLDRYKYTNPIAALFSSCSKEPLFVYLSEDREINRLFTSRPSFLFTPALTPDHQVFCGYEPLVLQSLNETMSLETYLQKYQTLPKIVLFDDQIYLIAKSFKKAKEAEEILKAVLLIQEYTDQIRSLDAEEMHFLMGWEREKIRSRESR